MRYWKFVEAGETKSVQSCSNDEHVVPGAVEIDEAEFRAFLATLPPIPEFDPDRVRAAELLLTSPDVITMPEMWELLRIFGRFHGIGT